MAKQRYVNTKVWSDDWISHLDPIEKLLFLYLLTNERTNICGLYELPLKFMAVETGIEKDMVEKVLNRFEKSKKVFHYKGWIYIVNFQKHQDMSNDKIKKGVEIVIESIPESVRVGIGYPYPSNNLNTNSNNNSNPNPNVAMQSIAGDSVNEIIGLFKELNPSYQQLFNNKSERAAVERLLKMGREKHGKVCEFFCSDCEKEKPISECLGKRN